MLCEDCNEIITGPHACPGIDYNVYLIEASHVKVQVTKLIRNETTLGLVEAKRLVEQAPILIKSELTKEAAETLCKRLEAIGARAEVRCYG